VKRLWRAFVGLSRRVRTLIVAAVLFVAALVLLIALPVPYVILSPGPTYNTLGQDEHGNEIIVIKGTTADQTTGNLNMTTVNVTTGKLTALQAFVGWLNSEEEVVPRSAVYPPGESEQQVQQQNTADFAQSQDSATAAAFCELGYPVGFGVLTVTPDGPSAGKLKAGDEFVSVNGQPADSYAKLTSVMKTQTPGETVPVVVKRQGETVTQQITLGAPPQGRTGATLGVEINDGTTCLAPFEVDLGLGNEIGGPSAGLMFALGIMDKVGTDNLTEGRFIAGTGTIDDSGNVGPIGGIQLKMIAARDAGATIFLAPTQNCADVVGATPKGLDVVKVDTLHHAVQYLDDLHAGKPVPHC
jgi:PDZ domain-containing protein